MASPAGLILGFSAVVWAAAWSLFCVEAYVVHRRRAATIALVAAVVGSAGLAASLALPPRMMLIVAGLVVGIVVGAVLLFGLPVGRIPSGPTTPDSRFDERDMMFSRALLTPGQPAHDEYYAAHPERLGRDDRMRRAPGLLSQEARLADPILFASAKGSFGLTESLRHAVDGSVAGARLSPGPEEATRLLKEFAAYYGAVDAGITALEPYHLYSHVGRGTGGYGEPIESSHTFAIAFTVEMAREHIDAAPAAPTVMESARQYVESARIAVQLAGLIRAWGWPARAHIDGNYQVVAPLVARDAGLGEIGRMGILMTPDLGPRVRLGVVTTELELVPDERLDGTSVIDFCSRCSKCVNNCPPMAIPSGERQEIDGALRWRINSHTCYSFWTVIGTDCARCMAVCPYSHPSTLSHDAVRWAVARSGMARRVAIKLDDLFYGRRPAQMAPPDWTRPAKGEPR